MKKLYMLLWFLGLAAVLAIPARADDVLINDLADTITMSVNGIVNTTCAPGLGGFEDCVLGNPIFRGSGTITNLPFGSVAFYINDGNGDVSDVLLISAGVPFDDENGRTFQTVGVEFVSDPDPGFVPVDLCTNHPGGCAFTETGSPQLAMTINWTGGTTLAISFESDVETQPPVPEPSSLMLLGTGLMGLGIVKRRFLS